MSEADTAELQSQVRFEVLIGELLGRFMSSPETGTDTEIEEAIRSIAECLGLDQGLLVQWPEEGATPLPTHSWTAAGGKTAPVAPGNEVVPWVHGQAEQGKIVMFSSVEDLPEEAERDKEFFRGSGRRSLISLPVIINGRIAGALIFASLLSEIRWSEETVRGLSLVADVLSGILEREENRLEMEDRLRFEMLLAEASTRLINLPGDRLDAEILDIFHRVCERLDIDRVTLWLLSEKDAGNMQLEYFYDRGNLSVPKHLDARQLFPWVVDRILKGEVLTISRLSDLPAEASRDRESFDFYGTRSTVVVPLSTGGSVFGAATFARVKAEREWPESIVGRLKLVAQIVANSLARQYAEKAMRESWERMNLAADSANAALWVLEPDSGHIRTVEKARKFLGVDLKRELNLETFLSTVHPEDRDRIREKMQQSVRTGEDFSEEYRVIEPEGVRWMFARGRPQHNASGEHDRLMGATVDITDRKKMEQQLCARLLEIEDLKRRLEDKNIYLQEEVKQLSGQSEIVGQSVAMKRVLQQAEQVARTDTTVLLQGETGTGKELLARAIHGMSKRKERPLVTVNCAALPPSLIESELFGREKGAFTGALTRMAGRFEIADGSSLFLDEIGELPLELQAKLLRVIEEGCFERLGSARTIKVDVRLIAATNRDLAREVEEGRFRKDLFYRLSVFPVIIPPLRERPEDIPLLVWSFVAEFKKEMGKRIDNIPKKTMDMLKSYSWPGNGRELRNVIERSMIVSNDNTLDVILPKAADYIYAEQSLREVERRHILGVLEKTSWRVTGKGAAAEVLGMKGTTLQSKMKKLGIIRPGTG